MTIQDKVRRIAGNDAAIVFDKARIRHNVSNNLSYGECCAIELRRLKL
jgi:hypothetical protein